MSDSGIFSGLLKSKFSRDVFITLLFQGGAVVVAGVQSIVVARLLGPEGKGLVALALTVPSMLALIGSAGLEESMVYFAASKRIDIDELAGHSILFSLVASSLAIVISVILKVTGRLDVLLPGLPTGLLIVGLVGLPFNLLSFYFEGILQGLRRIAAVQLLQFAQAVVMLLLTIILLTAVGWRAFGVLVAWLVGIVVSFTAAALVLRLEGTRLRLRWEGASARGIFVFGLKSHVGTLLQYLNYRLDLLLVNYFLDLRSVGIYTVSVALAELVWQLPNAVGFVIFPKAAGTSESDLNRFTPRVFAITLAITLLAAGGLASVGRLLIQFLYTKTFLPSYQPMLLLLPGVALVGAAKVLTNEMAGRGYPEYNSLNAGVSLGITLLLDFVLIPRLGVPGAAIASSVSYTSTFAIALLFFRRVRQRSRQVL